MLLGIRRWLNVPQDPAGLAAFRVLFGALMCAATVRFWAKGWIYAIYLKPTFHFTYLGFEWVRPWGNVAMYAHFLAMALSAACIALGIKTRLFACGFFLLFTWAELIEKAVYLNHYYLVTLLSLLLIVVPTDHVWAVWPHRASKAEIWPGRWTYGLMRAQIAIVYIFAGFAKLNSDWLFHAQPLRIWLQNYESWPLIGPWVASVPVAYAMSWAGAAFDFSIWLWLSIRRTRRVAYGIAVIFHILIWSMFQVGMFSWIMLAAATLFLDPRWPRTMLAKWAGQQSAKSVGLPAPGSPLGAQFTLCMGFWLFIQCVIPLRFVLYPGHVNWTEQGFRFAWRVMLVEKTGHVEYRVQPRNALRAFRVYPREELEYFQYRMLSTQPDMIHEYALHLAHDYRRKGYGDVSVFADAFVAWNARRSRRIVDPRVDLARQPRSLRPATWIVPL